MQCHGPKYGSSRSSWISLHVVGPSNDHVRGSLVSCQFGSPLSINPYKTKVKIMSTCLGHLSLRRAWYCAWQRVATYTLHLGKLRGSAQNIDKSQSYLAWPY